MTTTVNLRKILNRKTPEMVAPAPANATNGSHIIQSCLPDQLQLYMQASTLQYLYSPLEDSFLLLPSGVLGAPGAGSCGTHHPYGPSGTASAGSATTLTTGLTIPGSLAGYRIRITGGTGAGQEQVILSNTQGANSVITTAAWGTNPDNTSTYVILSGRFYVMVTTAAAWTLKYYDVATNTWSSALSVAGVTAAWTIDGAIANTCAVKADGSISSFIPDSTATSATGTTLTCTGKTWTTNQWTNYQVRIIAGTGVGQIRTIASNTATQLTVSAAWTVNPDATSHFAIEGNEDFLYLIGNNVVTLYRYSIAGNAWSTLTPGAARAAAPNVGINLTWVWDAPDTAWTSESTIINGRRLYGFRGGAGNVLDYYDIALNTWVSTITYQRQAEVFGAGTCYALIRGDLYIQKDSTGRFFRFNIPSLTLDPWMTLLTAVQGAATAGNKLFSVYYSDGATTVRWIYFLYNANTLMFRMLII